MDSTTSAAPRLDLYATVTDRIIELLETGTIPWEKPWTDSGIPMNLISKRPYRGINLWLLLSLNYERNLFLTWDQLKKIGGSVKQGEHGHIVIYWKTPTKDEDVIDGEKKKAILRYYKVFNISQCRDVPKTFVEILGTEEQDPILECEALLACMPQPPLIKYKEQQAYYHIVDDYINMPKKKSFKKIERYYSTLFHELVHSTGHEKRLNRKSVTEMHEFGSEAYSIEELIAELGSAFLCSFTGILNQEIDNKAAYINGWLEKLRGDKRFIVQASGHAQRAVDLIMNQTQQSDEAVAEVASVPLTAK